VIPLDAAGAPWQFAANHACDYLHGNLSVGYIGMNVSEKNIGDALKRCWYEPHMSYHGMAFIPDTNIYTPTRPMHLLDSKPWIQQRKFNKAAMAMAIIIFGTRQSTREEVGLPSATAVTAMCCPSSSWQRYHVISYLAEIAAGLLLWLRVWIIMKYYCYPPDLKIAYLVLFLAWVQ